MKLDDFNEEKKNGQSKKGEKIEVFTTPMCPYCTKIKKWFNSEKIEYEEHNVAENKEKAKKMIEMSGKRSVPQTKVGEKIIIGFQPEKIKEAIRQ